MPDLPIMLKLAGRRVVVVGGGSTAARRVAALRNCGAQITLIAPKIDPAIEPSGLTIHQRPYQTGDLAGAMLVIIATDDPRTNEDVAADARKLGVLVNRTDDSDACDFIVPAHARRGPITLAVSTDGISAAAAAGIRDQLLATLDADWITLLETAAPFRRRIQHKINDAARRTTALKQLTDEQAMDVLKREGTDGLRKHLEQLTNNA